MFLKTLYYLHISACLKFKADTINSSKCRAVPCKGIQGQQVISLRTLRKCISSLDPRRPEDSVISVVEALHNRCRCATTMLVKNKVNDNIEGSKKRVSNRADGLNTDSGGNVESDHEADSGGGDNHGHGKKVPDANSKDKSRMTKVTREPIVVSNSGSYRAFG